MSLDQLLRTAADDVAATALAPAPDVEALVTRARRRRRRRAGAAALGSAAALVLGTIAVGTVSDDRTPPAVVQPEPGPWLDGAAWLGERTGLVAGTRLDPVPGEPVGLALADGGFVYGLADGRVLLQKPGGVARQIGRHEGHGPVGDPDGTTVVWFDDDVLVGYDVASEQVAGRLDLGDRVTQRDWDRSRRGHLVMEVSPDRVRVEADGGVWDWRPGEEEARRVTGVATVRLLDSAGERDVVAGRALRDRQTGAPSLARLTIREDGVPVWGHGRVMPEASFSPDGRYLATRTGYGEGMRLVVLDLDRREVVELETPYAGVAGVPYPWGWALDGTLMVRAWDGFGAAEPNQRLLACVVADGTCHEVAREVRALPRD